MSIEEVIYSVSPEQKSKLLGPATKAFNNPDTGITANKPSALRVIKDCAETTILFLPIELFVKMNNPLTLLKGKFNAVNVTDLYNRSKNNKIAKLLFDLILETCPKQPTVQTSVSLQVADESDPYGDYDNSVSTVAVQQSSPVQIILQHYS
jgi:hypothetical protein